MGVTRIKILVCSDSHGNKQALLDAVHDAGPDMILFLGDGERDCAAVRLTYPEIPLRAVRGNCDAFSMEADNDEFVAEGKRIFMTHGHLYGVKYSLDSVMNAALLRRADILLFGHTHVPYHKTFQELLIVNPGSIGLGTKTYAVLTIEHGAVKCHMGRL